jgi:hypothetical protein
MDWRDVILRGIEYADVVLAVIGPDWEGVGQDGRRRIDDPDDMVRYELKVAFQMNKIIIPVVIQGREFPPSIPLNSTQAFFLDPRREFQANLQSILGVVTGHYRDKHGLGSLTFMTRRLVPRKSS